MDRRLDAATRDRETGLPNAAIFRDRLMLALEGGRRRRQPVCVMVVGVWADDVVEIAQAGGRIAAALRGSDTVARLEGSELALILPGLGDRAAVDDVVGRIRRAGAGHVMSVGYAISILDADEPESLLFLARRRRDDQAA